MGAGGAPWRASVGRRNARAESRAFLKGRSRVGERCGKIRIAVREGVLDARVRRALTAILVLLAVGTAPAGAAEVVVVSGGSAVVREDPALPAGEPGPA